jgi:hypothetical protein
MAQIKKAAGRTATSGNARPNYRISAFQGVKVAVVHYGAMLAIFFRGLA